MAAGIFLNGPSVIRVKGGAHVTSPASMSGSNPVPLGVTEGDIMFNPRFLTKDIYCDKLGPMVPADVIRQLIDVRIRMTLVYFDRDVLDVCIQEAQADYDFNTAANNTAGRTLGGNHSLYASGCHYMSLCILSPTAGWPLRFMASYLEGQQQYPVSVTRSKVQLDWRAVAYMTADETIQNTIWDYNAE